MKRKIEVYVDGVLAAPQATIEITFPTIMQVSITIPPYVVARDILPLFYELKACTEVALGFGLIEEMLQQKRSPLWALEKKLKGVSTSNVHFIRSGEMRRMHDKMQYILELFYAAASLGRQTVEAGIEFLEQNVFLAWLLHLTYMSLLNPIKDVTDLPDWLLTIGRKVHRTCIAPHQLSKDERLAQFRRLCDFALATKDGVDAEGDDKLL